MIQVHREILKKIQRDHFSDTELMAALNRTGDSYYGLVKRALARGEIIRIKRGLYGLAEPFRRLSVNLYELSQFIYGPSFVSFESALAYHDWIPEAVRITACACLKRARSFSTPLGLFHYTRVVAKDFFAGVKHENDGSVRFAMASPLRALCDMIYAKHKSAMNRNVLLHDLRIPLAKLRTVRPADFKELQKAFTHRGVRKFLAQLAREIL